MVHDNFPAHIYDTSITIIAVRIVYFEHDQVENPTNLDCIKFPD